MKYASVYPATNCLLRSFPFASQSQILSTITKSADAFHNYRRTTLPSRIQKVTEFSKVLQSRSDQLADLVSLEMGRPLEEVKGEVTNSINSVRYYASIAERALQPKTYNAGMKKAIGVYQPLGPLFQIMPWNYPVFLPLKNGIPSLLAGNTIILKPAPSVPQTAMLLEESMQKAGFENGEYQVIFSSTDDTEMIIGHPAIRGVALTGSKRAGSTIASLAGKYIKKCMLELGGSDAFIILEDVDIEFAARKAVESRLRNSGQACTNGKRFIIHQSIYEPVKKKMAQILTNEYKVGPPTEKEVKIGPLARLDLLENLREQVSKAIEHGARISYGDVNQLKEKTSEGNYFSPIFIQNLKPQNPMYNEELFGPVFVLYSVGSEEEAIALANESEYGLGGSVMSKDEERAIRVAKEMDTGMVFINSGLIATVRVPFGGVKSSGFGRECADEGFTHFTNLKTIAVP